MKPSVLVEVFRTGRCSLCEEALEVVEAVRLNLPFNLAVIDIEESQALFERYRFDVPVISVNGVPRFVHRVTPAALEACLKEALFQKGVGD